MNQVDFTQVMREDATSIRSCLEEMHPASVAESLSEQFSVEDIWGFLHHADTPTQAAVFEYFSVDLQHELLKGGREQHMARLIEQMSSDDRAEMLRHLPGEVSDKILRFVDEANRKDIASLVSHEEGTAGGLMTTDYAWLPEGLTAGQAIDRVRLQASKSETIHYIYLLDAERRLTGVVSLEELVLASPDQPLTEVAARHVISVHLSETSETVARKIIDYDLVAIPVVDDLYHMVGIITHDDVLDVIVEEASEDAYRQGGVGVVTEGYLHTPFWTMWRKRFVWLVCLFAAELFTFSALAHYQMCIQQVIVLALFVPLCISTGGNSGSQAATLITRALALGDITIKDWLKILWHEMRMGFALGLTLGTVGFIRAALTPVELLNGQVDWWQVSFTVAQAVTLICLWGTLVGSMLPMIFKSFGVDPAFASSPFVATFVDVTGIMIYFTAASMWIPALRGG